MWWISFICSVWEPRATRILMQGKSRGLFNWALIYKYKASNCEIHGGFVCNFLDFWTIWASELMSFQCKEETLQFSHRLVCRKLEVFYSDLGKTNQNCNAGENGVWI